MAHFKKPEAADQALASIFKTSYSDFEVIFVDNASNDGTADFLATKYSSLRVIKNDNNRGSGGAWNTGFRLINPASKYVAFVDCDVIFDPDWLFANMTVLVFILILILTPILHRIVNIIGYRFRVNEVPR